MVLSAMHYYPDKEKYLTFVRVSFESGLSPADLNISDLSTYRA